ESFRPHPFTALGWQVADVAATVRELAARGITFERFEGLEQDEAGVWTAPSGTRGAWVKDPDGDVLSLSQSRAARGRRGGGAAGGAGGGRGGWPDRRNGAAVYDAGR